jgi:hypothetical protein
MASFHIHRDLGGGLVSANASIKPATIAAKVLAAESRRTELVGAVLTVVQNGEITEFAIGLSADGESLTAEEVSP